MNKPSLIVAALCVCVASAQASSIFFTNDYDAESSPSEARNLRAAARYHWSLANNAQNKMLEAVVKDDVDEYEKWLEVMRAEDEKWQEKAAEYDQVRDTLEARIRNGELVIENFVNRYEKGTFASIVDHLTGRAKTK